MAVVQYPMVAASGSNGATKAEVNIGNSTRMIKGGLITIHVRNIGTISGDGAGSNLVTVDLDDEVHNLTTGDKVIVSGTSAFNETAQQTITVVDTAIFTYLTTTHTATGPETVGTISASSLFEVTALTAEFVDHSTDIENPTATKITAGPFLAQSIDDIATQPFTTVSVDVNGVIDQRFDMSIKDARTLVEIGLAIHPDLVTLQSTSSLQIQPPAAATALALHDFARYIRAVNGNGGNVYSPNGTNLTMVKTGGTAFILGANRHNDVENPNVVSFNASVGAVTFNAIWLASSSGLIPVASSDGPTTTVTIGVYDDGTGPTSPAASPNGTVSNNSWVMHRIALTAEGRTILMYGREVFGNFSDCLASRDDTFPPPTGFTSVVFRAFLMVKGNTTDLSSTAEAVFKAADRIGR